MDLIEQYRQMHREGAYGSTSIKKAPYILPYIQLLTPRTVIDYGCGQSLLADLVSERGGAKVTRYDPGLPAYDRRPGGTFDLLLNIDVLEHVPEEAVDEVIADMAALSHNALVIIDTRPAATTLSDGRNAHLTLRPPNWWSDRLRRHYPHVQRIWVQRRPASFITWPVGSTRSMTAVALAATYKVRTLGSMVVKDGLGRTLRKI